MIFHKKDSLTGASISFRENPQAHYQIEILAKKDDDGPAFVIVNISKREFAAIAAYLGATK